MTFKDIKAGYPVYILHRDTIKVNQAKSVAVSQPRIPSPGQFQYNPTATQQLLVDVTIEEDGVSKTYSIPETLEVTYAGDVVLATTRESIIREVEALKAKAEDIVASVDRNKAIVKECEELLATWNPAFKEKKETEERITRMEKMLEKITEKISGL